MARSHPPSLLTLAARTLREECEIQPGSRILVAVSGGPDSSALLHVLSVLAPRLEFEILAAGVNHGLRSEAAGELAVGAEVAGQLGVSFMTLSVRVGEGGNIQARAREARYRVLREYAEQKSASLIATGHHADDRAETVLLRLMRGSGPQGLAVLPAQAGDRVRPLLRARRRDIEAHLQRHGIRHSEDPSNADRRFARSRVRAELLPLMQELSPGIVGHLNELADALLDGSPLPRLWSPDGKEVPLKRAHIKEIRRAVRKRASVRVRISPTLEVTFNPKNGRLEVVRAGTAPNSE